MLVLYYWASGYYLKRHYKVFHKEHNNNRIHLGVRGRYVLGTHTSQDRLFYMKREQPGRESVVDVENLSYPILLPLANMYSTIVKDY